jgi:2-methylisocitrate lyase-like PEP mutase family enzyme
MGNQLEVIERRAECCEAGADAAWMGGNEQACRALRRAINKPLVGVLPRTITASQYREWGASCGVLPGILQVAALHAQKQVLEELLEFGTVTRYVASQPGIDEMQQFYNRQGNAELEDIERRFGG